MNRSLAFALLLLGCLLLPLLPTGARAEEEADPRGGLVTRLFDVGALTFGRLDFYRARPPLFVPQDYAPDEEWPLFGAEGEEPILPLGTIDELIEQVKSAVRPRYWETREGADVRSRGEHALVVRAEPAVLDAVAAFLQAQEASVGRMVRTEVHAVRLTRPEVVALHEEGLTDEAVGALVSSPHQGPGLVLRSVAGQQAAAWAGSQWAFVEEHDVEVAEGSQIGDPRVSVANLGLIADVRAVPVPRRRQVLVGLDVSLSTRSGERMVDVGETGTIQAPTFAVATARTAIVVPDGAWTLVDGVGPEGGLAEDGWYFLLRATTQDVPGSDADVRFLDLPPHPARGEAARDAFEVRYYPVRALSATVSHVRGWGTHLMPTGYTPPEPNELPEPTPVFPPEALVDLIFETSPDGTWDDPAAIEWRNGTLIVRQTPEVHAGVEAFLARLLEDRLQTVRITAQVVEMPAELARALLAEQTLSQEAIDRLVLATNAGEARRLAVATLTSLASARNAVTAGRRVPYVFDYDPSIAQEAAILEPQTARFLEGVELDVQPYLSVDRRRVEAQVLFLRAHQAGPMRTWAVGSGATIELPELALERIRTQVVLRVDGLSAVGAWGHGEHTRLLLLSTELE